MADSRSRQSPDLRVRVESRLRDCPGAGRRLCVALSGGRDSVVLLHLAAAAASTFDLALSAIHVNHQLSPNAAGWAEFCSALCARLGVPLRSETVHVQAQPGEGIEAAARRARYAVFASVDADAIALAHHAGDQAETLLFRLVRGSGVTGAAAMPERRDLARDDGGTLTLLRPLLEVEPAAIAAYAAAQGIAFVRDESNDDTAYARNFFRHDILPPLERRFPGAGSRLARAAGRFAEADEMLAALAAIDIAACSDEHADGLALAVLRSLTPARQRNLVYHWLRQAGVAVAASDWLDELNRQVLAAGADTQACIRLDTAEIRVWRGRVMLLRKGPEGPLSVRWNGEPSLAWNGGEVEFVVAQGEGITVGRLQGRAVELRQRAGGERLQPDLRRPRRSLKHWLQEAAIPPWERAALPCLWCDDELVWVPGIGIDARFAATPGEPSLVVSWRHSVCASELVKKS